MKIYLGIDPGNKTGAFAAVDEIGHPVFAEDCHGAPSQVWAKLRTRLNEEIVYCALERVHAHPKDGRVGAFSFGRSFGVWEGILLACCLPYEKPEPGEWQKEILGNFVSFTEGTVEYCRTHYPQLQWVRKKDHNRADALCLAEWARRRIQTIP